MALTRMYPQRKITDDKEVWDTYMSWGAAATHDKLREWYFREKGVRLSQMAAFWAMWRYAARNPEEAFPAYKKWLAETALADPERVINPIATYENFLEEVREHAINALGGGAYKKFCLKHGLEETRRDNAQYTVFL